MLGALATAILESLAIIFTWHLLSLLRGPDPSQIALPLGGQIGNTEKHTDSHYPPAAKRGGVHDLFKSI